MKTITRTLIVEHQCQFSITIDDINAEWLDEGEPHIQAEDIISMDCDASNSDGIYSTATFTLHLKDGRVVEGTVSRSCEPHLDENDWADDSGEYWADDDYGRMEDYITD